MSAQQLHALRLKITGAEMTLTVVGPPDERTLAAGARLVEAGIDDRMRRLTVEVHSHAPADRAGGTSGHAAHLTTLLDHARDRIEAVGGDLTVVQHSVPTQSRGLALSLVQESDGRAAAH